MKIKDGEIKFTSYLPDEKDEANTIEHELECVDDKIYVKKKETNGNIELKKYLKIKN